MNPTHHEPLYDLYADLLKSIEERAEREFDDICVEEAIEARAAPGSKRKAAEAPQALPTDGLGRPLVHGSSVVNGVCRDPGSPPKAKGGKAKAAPPMFDFAKMMSAAPHINSLVNNVPKTSTRVRSPEAAGPTYLPPRPATPPRARPTYLPIWLIGPLDLPTMKRNETLVGVSRR